MAATNEFDRREQVDRTSERRAETLEDEAATVSDDLPGDHRISVVSFDHTTGNAAVVVSHRSEAGGDDFVRRALDHVQHIGPALGLAPDQPPEYQADPAVQQTSSGSHAVHLRQQYKGISIYEASATVRFDPDGRLTEVAGRSHTVADDLAVAPGIEADRALRLAARSVADSQDSETLDPFGQPLGFQLDLSGFAPEQTSVLTDAPDRPQSFSAPPFDGSTGVRLIWFPWDRNLRLAWQVLLQIPHGPQYRVIVDAADETVMLQRQLARAVVGAADVYLRGGGSNRTRVPLPVPTTEFGIPLPDDMSPDDLGPWLSDTSTAGTNTIATVATSGSTVTGVENSGTVLFAPTDPGGDDQLVVNLFAFCGLMHDVFYALGFRETDGNFQVDNRGRGGVGTDRVKAIVHPGPVWGTANMGTPPDGHAPTMNMGLVARTGRHTALDADVVFHEYTHGLSNRLVGGPLDTTALDAPQSGGMGEGWGDYFACVLGGKETVGAWVVDNDRGIRGHRYDQNFPDNFGHLGSGRYTGVHAIGELWCATLMELNRRIGTAVAGQLVVDAMKLSASNPGFLAMRDAILVAGRDFADARGLGVVETDTLTGGIWEAFAHYGMGPGASSIEAGLGPVTTDFTTPPRSSEGPALSHTANPALAIPDNDPRGVASTITIAAGGVVTTASVHVRISHSYQGDLEVRLRAPDGPVTVLHNRSGGSSDDIDETWTSEDDLASLIGRGVAGDWTLEVVDRARFDTGTLDQWTLELTTADQPPSKRIEIAPGLLIPDNNADGVESSAELPGDELIRGLQLELDLTHTYIGDLIITLTGPTGASVVVHDRDGGSADNIIGTFSSTDTSLDAFVDLPVGGTWMLHVADHEGRDVGKLNRWALQADL